MPRKFHLLGEKTHQCRVRLPFYRWRAQFDLNCATVLTHDTVALSIWNDVNSQNCHLADHSRADGELARPILTLHAMMHL